MPKPLFTDFQEFCSFRGGRGEMMYRVNMIYSISRNSAFPEVGGRDPMPKLLFIDFQEF